MKNDVLTWIDICKDRDLFRMVVTNNYAVVEDDLLSPTAYDNIHATLHAHDARHAPALKHRSFTPCGLEPSIQKVEK